MIMYIHGFGDHGNGSKAEVLEEQIANEFANRWRWDNASMSDEKTRYHIANFDDDFYPEQENIPNEQEFGFEESFQRYYL